MDEFASPAERVPAAWDNAQSTVHSRYKAQGASRQAVWDEIAKHHRRRLQRAMREVEWLDRMYERYSARL